MNLPEMHTMKVNGTLMAVALTLIGTLIFGAYGYAYSIDVRSVKHYELNMVLDRFGSLDKKLDVLLGKLPR